MIYSLRLRPYRNKGDEMKLTFIDERYHDLSVLDQADYKSVTKNNMPYIPFRVFSRFMLIVLLLLQSFTLLASNQYEQIVHRDQVVSIYYQASFNEAERKMTYQWLKQVNDALLTVYNELPKDNYTINIEKSPSRSSPVPWGQVKRGTPTSVLLVINPDLGHDALISDWTVFHELSHLLIPYRGNGDLWLSEGLATYYQNIIQARSGRFDETKMWHKIVAGFKRGRNEQRWQHINLTEVSDNIRETRQFMRIHWSGVLFWLTADIELRKRGNSSLDQALKLLRHCCEEQSMSAQEIASKLDELTNENIFVALFDKYRKSYSTPEFDSILNDLGVKHTQWTGDISFDNDAPFASIRKQIYQR
jgi:hypothetical protein